MILAPRVSICIPVLNTRPFLDERRASIQAQTWQDYEIIVVDDGSRDGSWEFFVEWAKMDKRVSLHRGPRKGLYPGWNDAIRRAKGDFIYIATSDDTMAENFLEEMVKALERHKDCGVAHSPLTVFSEEISDGNHEWWSKASPFAYSADAQVTRPHKRIAPGDGLLHGCGKSVYVSTTQLLTRKSVFEDVGYFSDQWGSIGDFDWAVRVGLVTNTVHVPSTWAGWRIHNAQATANANMSTLNQREKNLDVFERNIKPLTGCPTVGKAVILMKQGWNYVETRKRFRDLAKHPRSFRFIVYCFYNPRMLLSALASRSGFKGRWCWEDEKVIIERLRKGLEWIVPV